MFEIIVKIIAKDKRVRKVFGIAFLTFGSLGIIIFIYGSFFIMDDQKRTLLMDKALPILIALTIIIAYFFICAIASTYTNDDSTLLKLQKERDELTKKIENDDKLDIFHTIQLSLNQLNEYYTINKSQAKRSFQFSMFSIVIGLATIICGIWFIYLGNKNVELSVIVTTSGILLEFVGGAYFLMYKRSMNQVNFFFGQLIKIQDTMLAINLAKDIKQENKSDKVIENIIKSLLKRSLT